MLFLYASANGKGEIRADMKTCPKCSPVIPCGKCNAEDIKYFFCSLHSLAAQACDLGVQAVVGAGAAGLVSARELRREGHSVVVLEQDASLGGIWNYSEEVEADLLGLDPNRERIHSSLYGSCCFSFPLLQDLQLPPSVST